MSSLPTFDPHPEGLSGTQTAPQQLGLNWSKEQRNAYLRDIKVIHLERLSTSYPKCGLFHSPSEDVKEQWTQHWKHKKLADDRCKGGKRPAIAVLDQSRLQYTIGANESVMIYESVPTKNKPNRSELVMVVLRDFIPDSNLCHSWNEICTEIVSAHRDDRRDDPGQVVHFGYTAGPRNDKANQPILANPTRTWKRTNQAQVKTHFEMLTKAKDMAALGWNICLSKLPTEVTQDFNDLIRKGGLPRMDVGKGTVREEIKVATNNGRDFVCTELELAPPSGISALNYARYTHRETNGNKWMVAITTEAPESTAEGGDFYVASFGVLMKAATNTLSAWRPADEHGTTLYAMGPRGNKHNYEVQAGGGDNRGFAFEIIKRMRGPARNPEEYISGFDPRAGKMDSTRKRKRTRGEEEEDDESPVSRRRAKHTRRRDEDEPAAALQDA